jgi:hypothetical protein
MPDKIKPAVVMFILGSVVRRLTRRFVIVVTYLYHKV